MHHNQKHYLKEQIFYYTNNVFVHQEPFFDLRTQFFQIGIFQEGIYLSHKNSFLEYHIYNKTYRY